jgi:uncharacterized protein (DUF885 family)
MKSFLTFFSKVLAIIVFTTNMVYAQNLDNNVAFNQFLEEYYEENSMFYPLSLTSKGDNRFNDQMPNTITVQFLKKIHDFNIKTQNRLQSFNRESLNSFDRISYDVLNIQIVNALEAEQFHFEYIPFDQRGGLPLTMPSLGSGTSFQPFKTVKDYENWLKRIDAFPEYIDTAIENFNKGIDTGMVMPKSLIVKMIPQLKAQTVTDTSKTLFYKPILNMPNTFSAKEKATLRLAYQNAIKTKIVPSYVKIAEYLQNTYLPKARLTSGYNDLPNGEAIYKYTVKNYTTTDKTPEEIHQLGLNEVKRITSEIEKLKNKIGFKGTIAEFFNYSLTDKSFFPFSTDEQILKAYSDILPKIEPNLKKLFNLTPKTAFEVKAVDKFKAESASASYSRGTADGSRPGYFNVPILNPLEYNKNTMESLFIHEAIPGHHYQLSLQQENKALPKIRQFASYSVFSEGWALYVESLGEELGLYTDPYQKLGAYKAEIFRAMRLVVDTALHTGKMTREEAIEYMMKNGGREEKGSTSEVERYLSNPGQALSYKIGELKMKELKAKYQKELGNKFDIKKFHDSILLIGSVPLSALETYLEDWAKTQI